MLRDGDWARAFPVAALLLPAAALVAGGLSAVMQSDPLWSFSLVPVLVLAAAGALGSGVGIWAGTGYVIGLFFFWRSASGETLSSADLGGASYHGLRFDHGVGYSFAHTYLGLLIAIAVLLELAVVIPAVAAGCRGVLGPLLRTGTRARVVAENVIGVVLSVVLTWQWTQAAQYAIRPYWTFSGGYPDTSAFDPLRGHAVLLWLVVGAVASVRAALTIASPAPAVMPGAGPSTSRRPAGRVPAVPRPRPLSRPAVPASPARRRTWWPVSIPVQATAVTLLASGVLDHVWQGVIFGAAVAAAQACRRLLLPRVPGFARAVNAVPLLARLLVIALAGALVGTWWVGRAYQAGTSDLISFAETAAMTVGAGALLLVRRYPEEWLPRVPGKRTATGTPPGRAVPPPPVPGEGGSP